MIGTDPGGEFYPLPVLIRGTLLTQSGNIKGEGVILWGIAVIPKILCCYHVCLWVGTSVGMNNYVEGICQQSVIMWIIFLYGNVLYEHNRNSKYPNY